jgi:type I restriction enzyme, S subunit
VKTMTEMSPKCNLEWEVKPFGEIAKFNLGRTPARATKKYWANPIIPWVAIRDLNGSKVSSTKEGISQIALEEVFKGKWVPAGTLLLSFKLSIGKLGILSIPAVHNEAIISIYPSTEIDRDFLYYNLMQYDFTETTDAYVKGSTLNREKLETLPICFPSLQEQQSIASVFRTIQQAKDTSQKVIDAARELKQSMMNHLFTFGLVPIDLMNTVEFQENSYGSVRSDWSVAYLSELAYVQTGVAKGRKLSQKETIKVPYLSVANVQNGRLALEVVKTIDIRKHELTRFLLQAGDVVLTEGGDFDKLGRGFIWQNQINPCVHQNHIFAVRTNRARLLPEYLAYLVQSEYGRKYFLRVAHKTTNLACINKTKLGSFPVIFPDIKEQALIADQLSAIDLKIHNEMQRSSALKGVFDTLLDYIMSGQLRLPEFISNGSKS